MSSPPNAEEAATAATEPVGSPTPAAPAANTPGQSRIGKAPKVKPLKLGYLSFKEGNMLKKTFKPRFCILNKNNELEAYRDPNDQATGTKHALLSDLHVCDVVDIKDDKNDGFLFSLRINKTLHELCADTEQERTNWIVEILKLRPVPYLLGLLDDATLAYYAAFALGNLATHYDEARLRIVKEGGHLRLFNYLETSGKSDEGLHDMIYFAFSKMTALDENKEALSMFITLFLQILNGSNERWKDFAIQALMNLSTTEANKQELKKLGGVKALLDVLSTETSKDTWKEAAVNGLANCATDGGVQLIVGEHVRALATLLEHKNLKAALKNACLSLLLNCVKNEKVFRAACDSPLIGSVLSLSEDADPGVSEKAASLVALLSVDPQCRPRIVTQLNVVVQGLKSKSETVIEGHLLILLRVSADKQGCIELGRPERVLPLLQILSAPELNRTVRNYAASTLLNVTALEESRVSLGKDASVLLALLDAVNKLSNSSGFDLFEKLLAALLRLSECDAVKLTLVRAPGALTAVVALLNTPVANILTPILGFLANCATHLCVRVELASQALDLLIRLLTFKSERVQELSARILAACAVPDAALAGWRKVALKDVTAVLSNKETGPKTQALLCRTLASLLALADYELVVAETGVLADLVPLLTHAVADVKESAARVLRNVTSAPSFKLLSRNVERLIEALAAAKNEVVEEAAVQTLCGCIRNADVSSEVQRSAVPHLLALLKPTKGSRVAEGAATALALLANDEACAALLFASGLDVMVRSIADRNDRVQRHLTAALSSCLRTAAPQKSFKEKGAGLAERLLSQLTTGNLDVLEHTLLSLRILSVSHLKPTLATYSKRLASLLDFPSEAVQDYTAGIIINTLVDDASAMQLNAAAGLQAVTAAVRGATDAKMSGAWSLSFSANSSGVPGKLEVTAAPPVSVSVSLATAEQRIGLAKAIARALCPDEMRDSTHTDRRRERPNSAPEEPSAHITDAGEAPPRRLSAGQSRGSGMMSLWQNRQPRRLKPKKMNLPAKGESSRSQSTRFSQRQFNALAFYHTVQEPNLSRRYPRLLAFLRESCPKEREAKEELALSRRAPNQIETSKLTDLVAVEREYTVSYTHTEPGTAALVRAKRPLPEDVTYAYFEILVLDAGANGTIAIGLASADHPTNQMPGWRPQSFGYHADDGNKYSSGANAAYGPVFTTGDIVGCGVNNLTGQVFFTKNGMFLGNAYERGNAAELYAAVALASPSERVYINLGQAPFAWDFEVNADSTLAFTPAPKVEDGTAPAKADAAESPLVAAYEAHAGAYSWMCASPQLAAALERNPSTISAKLAAAPAVSVAPVADPKQPVCNLCRLPVCGLLYVCSACDNVYACAECQALGLHPAQHLLIAVHNTGDDSCNSKFQPARFKSAGMAHAGTVCDTCNAQPISGARYEKLDLSGFSKYDLCDACHRQLPVQFDANFLQVPAPLERDVLPQQKAAPTPAPGSKS